MQKFEKANFNVEKYEETENYAKFVIEPLERGFGMTIGNALRRVLLSSIPGSAIYAIKVQGAIHEFSAVDGVVEDVTNIILNLKKLVFSIDSDEDVTMVIDVKGPAVVTGADIQVPSEVKMI
jgi:DNA-directed RNA polymerase subunit alpha